jgi:AraC-like DNA-binding protein
VQIEIDFFSLINFMGIIQGIFLSYFFLSKKNRTHHSNSYFGFILICLIVINLDLFLCDTNYMFYVLRINDFSEVFSLAIGPLVFCYIHAKVKNKKPPLYYLHFVFPLFFLIYSMPYHISDIANKYNSYVYTYHPLMEYKPVIPFWDPLNVRLNILEILIIPMWLYIGLSFFYILKSSKMLKKELMIFLSFFLVSNIIIVLLKVFYKSDLGDFVISSTISIGIYTLSFITLKKSSFFKVQNSLNKYDKHKIDSEISESIKSKLINEFEVNKCFLDNTLSLPKLSILIGSSSNIVSQILNDKMNKSFNEFVTEYRINESKKILKAEPHKTIEAIAYEVGFNSKSTFNIAFKKILGQTPSNFRNNS